MGRPEYEAACHVVRALQDAGHDAVFAGGCVRDRLLKTEEPKDYDVATSARPEEVKALFPGSKGVGEVFAVVLVRHEGVTTEVATFRKDGPYGDGRRPDYVEVGSATIREDAARRDFTINGMFEDPYADEASRLKDFHGGKEDLERKCVRAIGDPAERIAEDRLRMLRAVRFSARFQFQIEEKTRQAIVRHAAELKSVSRERIGGEVLIMLSHPTRAHAVQMLFDLGLDAAIFGSSSLGSCSRLSALPSDAFEPAILAAWALDRGMSGDVAAELRIALKLSNESEQAVRNALRIHDQLLADWQAAGVALRKRIASHCGYSDALALLSSTDSESAASIVREVDILSQGIGLTPNPLLSGADLISAGYGPGPKFAVVLDTVYDAQLAGEVSTRDEALVVAKRTFGTHSA